MPKPAVIVLKTIVHLLCLAPFLWLLHFYTSGALALNPDPVNYITHFTGDWTVWILLSTLAITPIRRLSPKISWLIRFRRLIGLYAFFYASLHLATYIFLFSGYDLPTVLTGMRASHFHIAIDEWKQVWPTIWGDIRKRRHPAGAAAPVRLWAPAASRRPASMSLSPLRAGRWCSDSEVRGRTRGDVCANFGFAAPAHSSGKASERSPPSSPYI